MLSKRFKPFLLAILLLAFALRVLLLTDLPPGLTHDEANHGREALGILDGVFLFYFPLNYGSEPVYSYTVAGFMSLLGESLFALRFVNVVFGTAVIALTYTWVKRAFTVQTALITAGLLSFSFWPLATSRQALRAGMLPFFFGLAVFYFWQLYQAKASTSKKQRLGWTIGFGTCIAITLHIYLASRVAWLLFPFFLIYLFIIERERAKKLWRPTIGGLLLTGLLILPMFTYLRQNPYALTRLDMLDRPLQELSSGNIWPILSNVFEALLAFVWPGMGDSFLAYNIPGRPVLDVITAVFFVIGLMTCLWYWKRPSYAFVLLWFGVGIVPSLLTGPTANTTRNLSALAVIHLIPALGFIQTIAILKQRQINLSKPALASVATGWLLFVGWQTSQAYFIKWGQAPDVRGAYQQNLAQSLSYLETHPSNSPVLISSVYPGPAHDPSISLVLTAQNPHEERWMDARYALLLPETSAGQAIIPQSTAPHPYFSHWLTPLETITLRSDDLDPEFTYYSVDGGFTEQLVGDETAVNFNNAITLIHAEWLENDIAAGQLAELLTIWRVNDPTQIGPIVPPTFTTDVAMFAQVLNADGTHLAQRDALDAPSWNWQSGDTLIQIQPIFVPETAVSGEYTTIVGFYDRTSEVRTPILNEAGEVIGDYTAVAPLQIK